MKRSSCSEREWGFLDVRRFGEEILCTSVSSEGKGASSPFGLGPISLEDLLDPELG